MIEVFITKIKVKTDAGYMVKVLKNSFPTVSIDFDLDEKELPYPCGHTVLRVEGNYFDTESIISILNTEKFICEVMEDKICVTA